MFIDYKTAKDANRACMEITDFLTIQFQTRDVKLLTIQFPTRDVKPFEAASAGWSSPRPFRFRV